MAASYFNHLLNEGGFTEPLIGFTLDLESSTTSSVLLLEFSVFNYKAPESLTEAVFTIDT